MSEGIVRESMVFYGSFYEAIKDLPPEDFKKCACAILGYGLDGVAPQGKGIEKTIFIMAKPQIDKNNQRYAHSLMTKKGNKAKDKRSVSETQASYKRSVSITRANVNENANDNENVNVNVNENVYDGTQGAKICEPPQSGGVCTLGEYSNVFLSTEEKKRLIDELTEEKFSESVDYLSRYIRRKPSYKSACHFEDLRGWVQQALITQGRKSPGLLTAQREGKRGVNEALSDLLLEDLYEN